MSTECGNTISTVHLNQDVFRIQSRLDSVVNSIDKEWERVERNVAEM